MKRALSPSERDPRLPRHLDRSAPLVLTDNMEIREVEVGQIALPAHIIHNLILEQARMRRVAFASTRLDRPRANDAVFDGCDFTASEWSAAHLLRVEFAHCRMLGMQWAALEAHDVRFTGCQCEGAFFASARLAGARFEHCVLRHASFEGADLAGARFVDCDLSLADLRHAGLAAADVRGCTLNGVRVEARDLQGLVLDPSQASQVAGLLGIIVKDLDVP
jgi:uncharacterized protein YjbI with pentapeptide repeats